MEQSRVTRRTFLADLGRFTIGVSVLGLAACGAEGDTDASPSSTTSTTGGTTTTSAGPGTTTTSASSGAPREFDWRVINFGNVSAVVLARAGEAVLVDTGNPGDERAIEQTLTAMDLGWDSLGHVIVTHRHGDHQGSLQAVMEASAAATAYCGQGDVEAIRSPRPITVVGNGDQVMDLDIIETPGHTPGHICVHDVADGLLIAGDALNGAGSGVPGSEGGVGGANPRFTADMARAGESIKTLATLSYDVAVFGHGAPLEGGASDAVAVLAASL